MTIFEELKPFGHIVVMDKDAGDYAIFTKYLHRVGNILREDKLNYSADLLKDSKTWLIDFNIYGKTEIE